jgi:hypothetical protein
MNLTEAQKKRLTEEVLGECWHEITDNIPKGRMGHGYCPKCNNTFMGTAMHIAMYDPDDFYRTFDTWQDVGDLKEALVKAGKWDDFEYDMKRRWVRDVTAVQASVPWLFRPTDENGDPHFALLVAEWLEVERK